MKVWDVQNLHPFEINVYESAHVYKGGISYSQFDNEEEAKLHQLFNQRDYYVGGLITLSSQHGKLYSEKEHKAYTKDYEKHILRINKKLSKYQTKYPELFI